MKNKQIMLTDKPREDGLAANAMVFWKDGGKGLCPPDTTTQG